jgi:hypothetical protein
MVADSSAATSWMSASRWQRSRAPGSKQRCTDEELLFVFATFYHEEATKKSWSEITMEDVRSSINAVLQAEQDLKVRHLKTTLDYGRKKDSAARPDLLAES